MIQLIIKDPVKLNIPMDVYQVIVTQMSGDADAYDETLLTFSDVETASRFVEVATAIQKIQLGSGINTTEEILLNLPTYVNDDIINLVLGKYKDDFISEITGYDVTSRDGTLACVDQITVFYYDTTGTQHEVEIIDPSSAPTV